MAKRKSDYSTDLVNSKLIVVLKRKVKKEGENYLIECVCDFLHYSDLNSPSEKKLSELRGRLEELFDYARDLEIDVTESWKSYGGTLFSQGIIDDATSYGLKFKRKEKEEPAVVPKKKISRLPKPTKLSNYCSRLLVHCPSELRNTPGVYEGFIG